MQIKYENIILRDMVESDIEDCVRWFTTETEWSNTDAPWEPIDSDEETERTSWREYYESVKNLPDDVRRRRFEIEWNGRHVGWVCSYPIDENYEWIGEIKDGQTVYRAVGIDICEPDVWGNGIGTNALRAFMNYYFENGVDELYTQTWSGNVRMLRCAEKLGFTECNRNVGVREVDGQKYDGLTFRLVKWQLMENSGGTGEFRMEYPISLYYDGEASDIKVLDLCQGEDDYRKVYIADDGRRRLVIKHLSNNFSDRHRIEGWFKLMEEYRKTGLYCPNVVPNRNGELLHCDTVDGRDYYTYAEEYSVYETAEHMGKEKYKDERGQDQFTPDVMRSLGKIASARLDILDFASGYCLLEPFCAPDTTDEATECALAFVKYIEENLPEHLPRAERLLKLFYQRQNELSAVYYSLPTSCFQADLNDTNILLDDEAKFVGLIDFNLCGREPILNYTVREALWAVCDKRLFGENDSKLYFYSKELDDLRISLFLENIRYIQETYDFTPVEREVFPVLFRYMNSFWWQQLDEIKLIGKDGGKIEQLLDWLELQMTRDDIRLP